MPTYLADRIVIMTPRPGRIRSTLAVALKRPRQITDSAFVAHVRKALTQLDDDAGLMPG